DLAEERLRVRTALDDLVARCDPRVEPVEADRADELFQLRPLVDEPLVAEELSPVRTVDVALDRDDRLTEQVAAHDRSVGVVELRRAEELAPEQVGAVDVRRVEQAHAAFRVVALAAQAHQPTSSGPR